MCFVRSFNADLFPNGNETVRNDEARPERKAQPHLRVTKMSHVSFAHPSTNTLQSVIPLARAPLPNRRDSY